MTSETDAADRISGKKNADRKNARSQFGIRDCTSTASAERHRQLQRDRDDDEARRC